MRATATAPRRRRPSAKGKKSRGVARERDPVAYYSNKIDRWFDAHPIAGFLVSAMTVFAFLYGAYAVSVATDAATAPPANWLDRSELVAPLIVLLVVD